MKDLMIDLETLGTDKDSVILSIGACFFDTEALELGPQYYARLEIETQLLSGRSLDEEALEFWRSQSTQAKKVFKEPTSDTLRSITEFCEWAKANSSVPFYVWANGAAFDIPIIEDLIKQCQLEVPWEFRHVQDLRTFRRFVGNDEKIPRKGTHHNALDDARDQAQYVIDQLRKRNEK